MTYNSWFPLLVKYYGDKLPIKVNSPDDLRSGVSFKVIATRYVSLP